MLKPQSTPAIDVDNRSRMRDTRGPRPEGIMTPEFDRDDQWWVSPFNVTDQVRRSFSLPPRVQIHDATLRDGEQTPGVVFSIADKIAIAQALAEVGVDRIEAGMPAVSDDDFAAIRQITTLGPTSKIYAFVRAITADIDKSLEC